MRRQWTKTGIVLASVIALTMAVGCGQKASETVAQKATEKILESALSQDGQKVDVKISPDSGGAKMTIQGQDADGKTVNMQIGGQNDGFSMTVQDAGGGAKMTAGASAKNPDDFPKDIPVYPGLKLQMVQTIESGKSYMVQGNSGDTVDKIAAFYKKEVAAQGWTEQSSMNQAGDNPMQMFSYEKGERSLTVMIMRDSSENLTSISLTTGQ